MDVLPAYLGPAHLVIVIATIGTDGHRVLGFISAAKSGQLLRVYPRQDVDTAGRFCRQRLELLDLKPGNRFKRIAFCEPYVHLDRIRLHDAIGRCECEPIPRRRVWCVQYRQRALRIQRRSRWAWCIETIGTA